MTELIFSGKEPAPAKINLSLEVLGRRPDNYHNLESLMVTVDLYDQLSLFLCKDNQSNWRVSSDNLHLPRDKNNIVYAAALDFFNWYQINPGHYSLDLQIDKNIPSQAGLGGGSADAAATLRLLERAFFPDENFDPMPTKFMAHEIGADVPYCYKGGTRYVRGIGDLMEEFQAFPELPVLLFKPPINISTKDAFAKLDAAPRVYKAENPDWLRQKYSEIIAKKTYSDFSSLLKNSFLPYLRETYTEINEYTNALKETGSPFVSLSGSGPTLFALYKEGTNTKTIVNDLVERFPQAFISANQIIS